MQRSCEVGSRVERVKWGGSRRIERRAQCCGQDSVDQGGRTAGAELRALDGRCVISVLCGLLGYDVQRDRDMRRERTRAIDLEFEISRSIGRKLEIRCLAAGYKSRAWLLRCLLRR